MEPSTFIQLHLLTAYPPANLNRDDMGRPKTAIVGGVQRLRVSSQSLKRAWRTSDAFQQGLEGHVGVRTKYVGARVMEGLAEHDKKLASKLAKEITEQFGTLDKKAEDGAPRTGQLVHLTPAEIEAIEAVVAKAKAGEDVKDLVPQLLGRTEGAADVALFGRMLADHPEHSVEAAAQVGHAFTIHKALVEEDYFSAVEELQEADNAGAGHIGVSEFGAGLFYQYVCVNRTQLQKTLGDEALATATMETLVEAVSTVAPRGKIASYGSSARALYVLAERGMQTPRNLMAAFVKPVTGHDDMLREGIERLETLTQRFDDAYGGCADARQKMDVFAGEGTLAELRSFVGASA